MHVQCWQLHIHVSIYHCPLTGMAAPKVRCFEGLSPTTVSQLISVARLAYQGTLQDQLIFHDVPETIETLGTFIKVEDCCIIMRVMEVLLCQISTINRHCNNIANQLIFNEIGIQCVCDPPVPVSVLTHA